MPDPSFGSSGCWCLCREVVLSSRGSKEVPFPLRHASQPPACLTGKREANVSLRSFRDIFLPQQKHFPSFLSTESKAEFTDQWLSVDYLTKEAGLHQVVLRSCAALIRRPHRQGGCK